MFFSIFFSVDAGGFCMDSSPIYFEHLNENIPQDITSTAAIQQRIPPHNKEDNMSGRVQGTGRQKSNNRKSTNGGRAEGKSSWKPSFKNESGDNNNIDDDDDEEFDEKKQCVICAEKIVCASLSPCNHTTCHKCTFRQRALYDKKACLVCRTENPLVVFTEQLDKEFDDFKPKDLQYVDEDHGVAFSSESAYDDSLEMLAFRCQVCRELTNNFKQLAEHIRTHNKHICTICTVNKKAFPFELKIYTDKQLQRHQTQGDEKGFNGHPLCSFCKGKRFYSEDELTVHLRQAHEKCHVCDQINQANPQYFKNYESLEEHFKRDHYICNFQSCLDKKFIVFADDLDLQAHMIGEHGGSFPNGYVVGMGPSRASYGGRFQSQLSTFRSTNADRPSSSSSSTSLNGNASSNTSNDSQATKRLRFEERARHYLNYSTSEFKRFTDINNSFRNGHLDSHGLKSSYEELFKTNTEEEIYLLVYDFAQLFPNNSAQNTELNNFVKKHEQQKEETQNFPALPGTSSSLHSYGNWGNSRPSKKEQKKALNEAFPALPTAAPQSTYTPVKTTVKYKTISLNPVGRSQTVKVNQGRSTYVPNYLSTQPVSAPPASTAARTAKINDQEFPELPKAKPKTIIPRVNPVPQGNGAWDSRANSAGSSASNSSFNMAGMAETLPDGTPVVTKGKGKKKKQILFSM